MPNLSTPVLWYPGQTEVDLQEEIDLMLVRTKWTSSFLKGEIQADTFLDFLNEQGYDVFDLADDWGLGDGITS
ncbi:hypothetical protein ACX27_09040 [Nostoc piscinale CENA21]|uniref:Uncharacterized protein n=1 Tax=Nostoc piscinale CENA21 TaxID=224013 RepID=A0A0M3V4Y9_9NOSO|nr:hypothetical protein [Nostoc piscinale]ALF52963.1 hypothetical protein ACX27_09040 [Nostoc piscinale CENA21]